MTHGGARSRQCMLLLTLLLVACRPGAVSPTATPTSPPPTVTPTAVLAPTDAHPGGLCHPARRLAVGNRRSLRDVCGGAVPGQWHRGSQCDPGRTEAGHPGSDDRPRSHRSPNAHGDPQHPASTRDRRRDQPGRPNCRNSDPRQPWQRRGTPELDSARRARERLCISQPVPGHWRRGTHSHGQVERTLPNTSTGTGIPLSGESRKILRSWQMTGA